jgi:hypothetical protein
MSPQTLRLSHLLAFVALAAFASSDLSAQRGGRGGGGGARAGGQARSSAGTHHRSASTHRGSSTHHAGRTTSHRSTTASNNRGNGNRVNNGNINTGNVNVNVNGHGYGYGHGYHPVARGVVAGATAAAVMGHYYHTLPSGCSTVNQHGIVYHHCGSTWYQTEGSQYVVVQQP